MIHAENLKIFIHERHDCLLTEIWIRATEAGEGYNFAYDGKFIEKQKLEIGTVPDYKKVRPFLTLNTGFAKELFKAIVQHNADNGIKSKDENLLEGKLQATELHLEDMRKLANLFTEAYIKKQN